MLNKQQIRDVALKNSTKAIQLINENINLNKEENRILESIDTFEQKISNIRKKINELKKSKKEDEKFYKNCEKELLYLIKNEKIIETREHIKRLLKSDFLDKKIINQEHSNYFGQMCELDNKALSLFNDMLYACTYIMNKEKQINYLKKCLKNYKVKLKSLKEQLIDINYNIDFCENKMSKLPDDLKRFYQSANATECSKIGNPKQLQKNNPKKA